MSHRPVFVVVLIAVAVALGFPFWGSTFIEHPRDRVLPSKTRIAFNTFGSARGYRSQGYPVGHSVPSRSSSQSRGPRVQEVAQSFISPADGVLRSIDVALRTLRAPASVRVSLHGDKGDSQPAELLASYTVELPDNPDSIHGRIVKLEGDSLVPLSKGYRYWVVASGVSGVGAVWPNAEPLSSGGVAFRAANGPWSKNDLAWRCAVRVTMETRPKR